MKFTRGNTPPPGNGGRGGHSELFEETMKKGKSAPEEKQEKQPWSAPNGTHGGFASLRLYRERNLDLRRADHRMIHEWQLALIEDLGGQKVVDTFQRSMIDRATELLIVISKMAEHVEATGIIQGDSLAPCLKTSFIAFVNSFRRTLEAAFEHGKVKGKKPPNLGDYLKENYGEEEGKVEK